ncbi:MAG: hypothetical protein JHD16_00110 [Solirubrobacteraceae bacterium]|nr:hypothetical protein [Solirubrobacteraceae bacterium]
MLFSLRLELRAAALDKLAHDASVNHNPASDRKLTDWSNRIRQQQLTYELADRLDAHMNAEPVGPPVPAGLRRCEACGIKADDLVEHDGTLLCPDARRCDRHANETWLNADIQAGINAEMWTAGFAA